MQIWSSKDGNYEILLSMRLYPAGKSRPLSGVRWADRRQRVRNVQHFGGWIVLRFSAVVLCCADLRVYLGAFPLEQQFVPGKTCRFGRLWRCAFADRSCLFCFGCAVVKAVTVRYLKEKMNRYEHGSADCWRVCQRSEGRDFFLPSFLVLMQNFWNVAGTILRSAWVSPHAAFRNIYLFATDFSCFSFAFRIY